MFSQIAYAHDLYNQVPRGLFQLKWDWDPTLVFFIILSIFYVRGLRAFGNRSPVAPWQIGLFFTGVSICALALLPPIDPLSDQLFFVHMIQHLLMVSLGIPLMLFGVPFFVVMRGMPLWFRRRIYFPILRSKILMFPFWILSFPLAALIFFEMMIWLWHVPFFYNLALFNDMFHLVEHASFALAAMFLWRNIVAPHPVRSKLPMPARLLFIAIIMALNIALSAWLSFSDRVLYGYEGIPQPTWWTYGYLVDQQLGGLIMWVPGGIIHFLAMTVCFFVWAHHEQKKDEAKQKIESRGCGLHSSATVNQRELHV